jgi:Fe-S oxidoreductase
VARGDAPHDAEHAKTAWGCTGCYACRESCDHRNPVAETLYAARAAHHEGRVAPAQSEGVILRHPQRLEELRARRAVLAGEPGVEPDAKTAVLVGCAYLRHEAGAARDALRAVVALAGPVRLLDGCCGAPLYFAGDGAGFELAKGAIANQRGASELLVVVDPGCALLLREQGATTLVELAAEQLDGLRRVPGLGGDGPVRFQDACQLGRGLGLYDPPRQILERALGRAPDEFARSRERAVCTGAGGLLPAVMPETSAAIADTRLAEHAELGGGCVVAACASGLRRLRSRGARVIDLHTVIREACDAD